MTYSLWGSAPSLYTGKVRSYLIKKGLVWRERNPGDPDFAARILPVVKHFVIPVLEAPDGTIVQDSGDIIDFLEARHPDVKMDATTPVQRLVSALFDAVGSEYLLPLAMHYRWSYRAEQEAFLSAEFGRTLVVGETREERRAMASQTMAHFAGFLPNLGVLPDVVEAMETSYLDWMDALDVHFQHHPYLLGGRPCRGDFGMMASLYAHLGRDPVPAGLMKRRAPNLYRWTERMNLSPISDGEFPGYGEDYAPGDSIPDTLKPVLTLVFRDWTPGLMADAACFNAWAEGKEAGTAVSHDGARQVHPHVGRVSYPWHGVEMKRTSAPHALWMLQSVLDLQASLPADVRAYFKDIMHLSGGDEVMKISLAHHMKRDDNVLVLA